MKQACIAIVFLLLFSACKQQKKIIVDHNFTDSLLIHFSDSKLIKANQDDINFWKGRITNQHDYVNETKYAALLAGRFGLLGDIHDLILSDSVLQALDAYFNYKEPGLKFSLIRNAIMQHRFREADSILNETKNLGVRQNESASNSFDVDFELGRYQLAGDDLKRIAVANDFGYQFRRSKLFHYNGELDSAIACMQQAVIIAGNDIVLKQAALSNTADLYMHDRQLEKAYDLYVQSIKLSSADLHSLMGIGWIALVHDKNDPLAEKIFAFVHTKTKIPDPLFKFVQVAQQRKDSLSEKKYAILFVDEVSDSSYGNMYNKYLIQLFTGILHDPSRAELVALKEIKGRPTPQTYAWYVWTLFCNNKINEASRYYDKYVSGKPLEGLELYWMGKFMKSQNKGYNAQQFFEKATKNKYDLSPSMINDLESISKE